MKRETRKSISLSPLSFDEAVTDILKIKPEPKLVPKSSIANGPKRKRGGGMADKAPNENQIPRGSKPKGVDPGGRGSMKSR